MTTTTATTSSSSSRRKRALPTAAAGDGSAGPAAARKTQKRSSSAGCLTILQAPVQAEPISHEAPGVFERLLSPLTVDHFLEVREHPPIDPSIR